MSTTQHLPDHHPFTLNFNDSSLESVFRTSYDRGVRIPLRQGIIISILSWYASIGLVYFVVPEKFYWLAPLTLVFIGAYFWFLVFATYSKRFTGYYHILGAISNAWAGLYAIYYCDQFPEGQHLTLPVLIFIIFFGSYMVRLRWIAGGIAALTYTIGYCIYVLHFSDLTAGQMALYVFVIWMTFIFAIIAGRVVELNNRVTYIQRKIIAEQNVIIEKEKQVLLQEVHHRVKNNLQIIVSLINLELSKRKKEGDCEALRNIQGRVMAMSLVHLWMNRSSHFERISVKEYIGTLITSIKDSKGISTEPKYTLDISAEATVDLETAIPLGIILNEIINNYFQHVTEDGEEVFTIRLHQLESGLSMLEYSDTGRGFPAGTELESDERLGLELIQLLAEQIDGDFKFYNKQGAVYEVTFRPQF